MQSHSAVDARARIQGFLASDRTGDYTRNFFEHTWRRATELFSPDELFVLLRDVIAAKHPDTLLFRTGPNSLVARTLGAERTARLRAHAEPFVLPSTIDGWRRYIARRVHGKA